MAGRAPATPCASETTHSKRGGDPGLADIGAVYLYRFAEGELPARAFLDSYRAHPAGVDHDLHVVFKGFPNAHALAAARTIFAGLPINPIELDDTGFDVGSYFAVAKLVSNRRLIFFNTFSELLADDWLKKFDNALSFPDVGLVGATASWQSLSSYYEVLIRLVFHEIIQQLTGHAKGAGRPGAIQDVQCDRVIDERDNAPSRARGFYLLLRLDKYLLYLHEYGRYPNPHVRSNAFMIERDRFLSLSASSFSRKSSAYKFESGRQSMTKQIVAQNLKPVVIDRHGKVYGIAEWRASSTYWVDQQANLIAADNRTRQYATGDAERRRRLEDYAWVHPSCWTLSVHRSRLQDELT
jgi:hypothetical protein